MARGDGQDAGLCLSQRGFHLPHLSLRVGDLRAGVGLLQFVDLLDTIQMVFDLALMRCRDVGLRLSGIYGLLGDEAFGEEFVLPVEIEGVVFGLCLRLIVGGLGTDDCLRIGGLDHQVEGFHLGVVGGTRGVQVALRDGDRLLRELGLRGGVGFHLLQVRPRRLHVMRVLINAGGRLRLLVVGILARLGQMRLRGGQLRPQRGDFGVDVHRVNGRQDLALLHNRAFVHEQAENPSADLGLDFDLVQRLDGSGFDDLDLNGAALDRDAALRFRHRLQYRPDAHPHHDTGKHKRQSASQEHFSHRLWFDSLSKSEGGVLRCRSDPGTRR